LQAVRLVGEAAFPEHQPMPALRVLVRNGREGDAMAEIVDTELAALKAVEHALRKALHWQWEDGADEDCAADMAAVRDALSDLDAVRRVTAKFA
jgi:hypothetical protein